MLLFEIFNKDFIDRNGKSIKKGSYVRFVETPLSLLKNLPLEDQQAIKYAITKKLQVSELKYDYIKDNIEIAFEDKNGNEHVIFVAGKYLEVVK